MIVLLSPSKTLDTAPDHPALTCRAPEMLKESEKLVGALSDYSASDLKKLMGISDKLAELNRQRYQHFSTPFTEENSTPALFTFKGDVYNPLPLDEYDQDALRFADRHVRILSGLYGLLRPLDYMQPYRLEMGTKLGNERGRDLYEFWGNRITEAINRAMEESGSRTVINLASGEYFKAVKPQELQGELITIDFKEQRGNSFKTIGLYAKKARGMMTDYIIRNRITEFEQLRSFSCSGYAHEPDMSGGSQTVFVRTESAQAA